MTGTRPAGREERLWWWPWIANGLIMAAIAWWALSTDRFDSHETSFDPRFTSAAPLDVDFPAMDEAVAVLDAGSLPVGPPPPRALVVAAGMNAERAGQAHSAARCSRRLAPSKGAFAGFDRNGDAKLTPAEFAIWSIEDLRPCRRGTKADDFPPFVGTNALNRIIPAFMDADRDGDHRLNSSEFAAAAAATPLERG